MTSERGNVFVESLLAVAILVVAIVPAFGMLVLAPNAQAQAAQTAMAENLARARLEKYESIDTAGWDNLQTADLGVVHLSAALPDFDVAVVVTRPDPKINLKNVTVQVSWQDGHGKDQQVQLATSIARR